MDHFKKTLDDGFRKIKGKIELVRKPHASVKEWLDTYIPKTASSTFLSLASQTDDKISSTTTSGPSSVVSPSDYYKTPEMPSNPSRFLSMNVELCNIFDADDGKKMKEVLEKGMDPNFVGEFMAVFSYN